MSILASIKPFLTQVKFWVILVLVLVIVGGGLFLGLSHLSISQQQTSTQTVSSSQIVQNQNINMVYAGNAWIVTNEAYAQKTIDSSEVLGFINTLNYYQQTRMHLSFHTGLGDKYDVFYPITPANTIKTVTNFVSNVNSNYNGVSIKPVLPKNSKWWRVWDK